MKLFIENIKLIPRNTLVSLAKYLISSTKIKNYDKLSQQELTEQIFSSLNNLLNNDFDEKELERKFLFRLSSILNVNPKPNNKHRWSDELQIALGRKIVNEIEPVLEIAHFMSWSDGTFASAELEVLDLLFSQLNLLRPFKQDIINFCVNSIPMATLRSDLAQFKHNKQKVNYFLSFAWAMAMADNEIHEKEYSAYNQICDILEVPPNNRAEIIKSVEERWKLIKAKYGTEDTATLVVKAAGIDTYIHEVAGMESFKMLSGINLKQFENLSENLLERLNSITLFSKINILYDPSLNAVDRALLIIAIVISES